MLFEKQEKHKVPNAGTMRKGTVKEAEKRAEGKEKLSAFLPVWPWMSQLYHHLEAAREACHHLVNRGEEL